VRALVGGGVGVTVAGDLKKESARFLQLPVMKAKEKDFPLQSMNTKELLLG